MEGGRDQWGHRGKSLETNLDKEAVQRAHSFSFQERVFPDQEANLLCLAPALFNIGMQ